MDGTKILLIAFTANLFIVVSLATFGSTMGMHSTWISDDMTSFMGFNTTGYQTASSVNDSYTNRTIGLAAQNGSNYSTLSAGIQNFQGGSAQADILGIGAMTAMWTSIVLMVKWILAFVFAPLALIDAVGLGNTMLMPLVGLPWTFLIIWLLVQFFWRFKA